MKRFVYMLVLILCAVVFSYAFSFAGADRFLFYAFFFFISAFLCGLKPMLLLGVFCLADGLVFNEPPVHLLEIFSFSAAVCLCFRKLRVYPSAVFGYLISLAVCAVFQLAAGGNILAVFDKWISYLVCLILAPPFVFALMRAGIVRRKRG